MFSIHPFSADLLPRRARRGPVARSTRRRCRGRRSWKVEALEDRRLLTTWTVNSLGDTGTGTGKSGDLRYCITQADATSGDNTIDFSVTGTITLNSALPDLSNTTGLTDIEGPGATSLTVARSTAAGTPDFRIFTIDTGTAVNIDGLTIMGGKADGNGGGIDNESGGTLTVTNSTIANNSAGTGGGIYNALGTMTVADSTIANNTASRGGGIENAIFVDIGTVTVTDSTIANNSASIAGGIENLDVMTVANCTVANNSGSDFAGGIFNDATLTLTGSAIANNSAGGYGGGGINNEGTMTATNSTIANNSAVSEGGAISNGHTLTITNSTIAYNNVASGGVGGGLRAYNGSIASLNNTIVALNSQGTGSGATASDIWLEDGGTVSSSSAYNLIGTGGSGGLVDGVNGNQVGVANPGLDALANNGGPTQTIALLSGSPAIDMGSNALAIDPTTGQPLQYDQRGPGFARIVNGTVDIGAFEVQPTNQLAVTAQPPDSVTAGTGFGFTVTAEDQSGNVISSFDGSVTVALSNNPGGATLGGTLTVTAQSGVATFSDLTLDKADIGYTLLVTASGLASATTDAITVTPAAASQLVVTTQPPASVVAGSGFGLVVSAEDPSATSIPPSPAPWPSPSPTTRAAPASAAR
jgi:hypothetical protein